MGFKSDFENSTGWTAVDTNVKLDDTARASFIDFLKSSGVETVIRYFASTHRRKTISSREAQFLSQAGFHILPVFQDRSRSVEDFGAANGRKNADSAAYFAAEIGQPDGTTILFAVDTDFNEDETRRHVVPYFEAIRARFGSRYRLGAYASGLVLRSLLDEKLIEVPWISMSRSFRGTKDFFYTDDWLLRQVPPDLTHAGSRANYDRNILRGKPSEIGAFTVGVASNAMRSLGLYSDSILWGRSSGAVKSEFPLGDAPVTANAYVSTEGLNLRAEPDGAVVRELTIGEPVEVLGATEEPGWQRVRALADMGVVFGKYLRKPEKPEIEALLARHRRVEAVRQGKSQRENRPLLPLRRRDVEEHRRVL